MPMMFDKNPVAHIIYLRDGPIVLSKVRYSNWKAIQDDYSDYMTSLGPWDTDGILTYFEDEYKEEESWAFSRKQIQDFMNSREHILLDSNIELTNLPSKSAITLQFNNFINSLDLDGLSSLMTDDHTFIDSSDDVHDGGKEAMTEGWRDFFRQYPEYRNIFTRVFAIDGDIIMVGFSVCPNEPVLDGPAIWTAKIRDGLVAEWHVYLDTRANRELLHIE